MKHIKMKLTMIFVCTLAIFLGAGFSFVVLDDAFADSPPIPLSSLTGQGTENSPYLISNAADLRFFADLVNDNIDNFTGRHVALTTNIDLGGTHDFRIGTSEHPFRGHFNGRNHLISGLSFHNPNESYIGLFGHIELATIENIAVRGNITSGNNNVGGIVGFANLSRIENSFFEGTISGGMHVGGIVGNLVGTSTVANVYSKGHIIAQHTVGGIAGSVSGASNIINTFSTMRVDMRMQGAALAGGIVGNLSGHARGNIALNSHIIPRDYSHRIASGIPANLSNNFAFDTILNHQVDGVYISDWTGFGASTPNGQSISNETILAIDFWMDNNTFGAYTFDDTIWYFSNNRLPRLSSFMTNPDINQTGQVGHILPSININQYALIINPDLLCDYDCECDRSTLNRFEFVRTGHTIGREHIFIYITADTAPLRYGIDFYVYDVFYSEGGNRVSAGGRINVIGAGTDIYLRVHGMAPEFGGYTYLPYRIVPRVLDHSNLVLTESQFYFSGSAHTPGFSIQYDGFIGLAEGGNYFINNASGTSVGYHYVELVLSGNYSGTIRQRFYINRITGGGTLASNVNLAITGWQFGQFNATINSYRLSGFSGIYQEAAANYSVFIVIDGQPDLAWNTANIPQNAGRHTIRADFNASTNFEAFSLYAYFYISPISRGRANMPILEERTPTTLLLVYQGAVEFAIREYGSDAPLVWQTGRMFYALEPNTEYEIFARYAALDGNHLAGAKSYALEVSTIHVQLHPLAVAGIIGGSAAAVSACVFGGLYVVAKKKKKD